MIPWGIKIQSIYCGIQSILENTGNIKYCIVKNFSTLGSTLGGTLGRIVSSWH